MSVDAAVVPILNKTNGLQYCTIHNCNVHESRRELKKGMSCYRATLFTTNI